MSGVIAVLAALALVGIVYIIRYYMVTASLKSACEQLREIEQSPEENRILLIAHANTRVDRFLQECNRYIGQNQMLRIRYEDRERKLRRQIEAVSHDLRTPLTAILGYLELLEWETLYEENRESLEVVTRKAGELQKLIANFYDLSRLELGDYRLQPEVLDLSRFVREALLLCYNDLEQRGLEVFVDCEREVRVLADESALGRVMSNMLQNALRYAESHLKVTVGTEEDKAFIRFQNDTNTLKEQDVPHLFERFYMTDAARGGQGTGLGLTISRLLVEAMGGSAGAELTEGELVICYTFPLYS